MDVLSKEQRSRCMARIKGKDTKPELIVRQYLYSRGYRYRKNVRTLPGTPDIALKKYRVAIFIHGCFWHGHEPHLRLPKSNREYWEQKIARNRERDEENKERLRRLGWSVMTVWECQLRPECRRDTLLEIEYHLNHNYLNQFRPPRPYNDTETGTPQVAESNTQYQKTTE